ncbi:MAG: pantetheine-phosphate adenylyltransferase [Spirochaetes bacterium]|nr:pantetheine-phosphate adenylyltransferase [Spirochaetota bacterium]
MRIGIYPGSFDPITLGHIDIIKRAGSICDKLIIAAAMNISKKPLFNIEERLEMIRESCNNLKNIEITTFNGLLADYCIKRNVNVIIRGLRPGLDFDNEYAVALINRRLAPEAETIFFPSDSELCFVSSSMVKEIASYGGDVTTFVPQFVKQKLSEKFSNLN